MSKKPVSEASNVASTKFQPGQSGNPKGRPLSVEHFRRILRDYAREHIGELLEIVRAHAYDNPSMAMELIKLGLEPEA